MKKQWSITLSLLAGFVGLWFIFTKFSIREVIETFSSGKWWMICLYLFAIIGMMTSLVWRWVVVLKSQGYTKIPFWHLFWYKIVGYAVSYITPTAKIGGEPVRAGLLKRHNIPFKEALSTVVIDKTLELSTCGMFFALGVVVLFFKNALTGSSAILFGGFALAFVLLISAFYLQMFRGKAFMGKVFRFTRLHKLKKGAKWEAQLTKFEQLVIKFYHKDTKIFWYTIFITAISWIFTYLEYKSILLILGYSNASILQVFMIFSFVGAAYLVPIPMAVGSLEASQIGVFAIIGLPAAAGIALALVTRIKDIMWTALGFIALSIYGLRFGKTVREASYTVTRDMERLHQEHEE